MENGYQFQYVSGSPDCGVIIYDRATGAIKRRMAFDEKRRIGRLNRMELPLSELGNNCMYQFYDGTGRYPDKKGRLFCAAKKYGEPKGTEDIYTVLDIPAFDWQGSINPRTQYEDSLIYCIHVRGFSRHISSGVKARGTFAGVTEKIPYLKGIGVTCLEFQPIYEFNERTKTALNRGNMTEEIPRLNYWGYIEGYYYAPKADYAKGNAVTECKEMVRELHKNGMEAVLQFYFPTEFNPMEIPEVLRFWVEEYHVDGFHLIGENLPSELIARDPELSETKLWYYQMDPERIYGERILGKNGFPPKRIVGLVRDDYMYDVRRFLKGEEGLVGAMMYHLRAMPQHVARIHYLTTYWGFTLMDMVSYDFKHNEENGEDNHDGTDYNCSWNCGEEGYSRKKKILALRLVQIKNAISLLFFTQSTPRIFMGDEFGNTQKGNNNPYCQDNEITWLNWKNLDKNHEIMEYFRKMSEFRRRNKVLHLSQEAKMMDMLSCGYPDISYHGMTAWRPQMEHASRQLGVMYCGEYGDNHGEDFIYLAMNMHWESHSLALPRLPKGKEWVKAFSTNPDMENAAFSREMALITPKTVAVFTSVAVQPEDGSEEKQEEEPEENE